MVRKAAYLGSFQVNFIPAFQALIQLFRTSSSGKQG